MLQFIVKIFSILAAVSVVAGCYEVKEAGRTIGHTTKNVMTEIGHGTRDSVKVLGKGAKRVTRSIADDVPE